jgi:hypothetical protein
VRTLVQSDNFFYVLTYSDVTWYFLRTATKVTFEIKTRRPQHNDNDHTGTFFINATSRAVLQDYKRQSTNQSSIHPEHPGYEEPCYYEAKKSCRRHRLADQESSPSAVPFYGVTVQTRIMQSRFKHKSSQTNRK